MTVEIVGLSPGEVAAGRAEIGRVFAGAFGVAPDEAARFVEDVVARHSARRDFRFLAAREGGGGRLLGFIYGYTGEPGQWFHDLMRVALDREAAARWLAAPLEVVEFGVLPEAQGLGIGGRLHDELLAGAPNRAAILSTRQGETAASGLYRRRGWQTLLRDYHFPGGEQPYTILGLDLTEWRSRRPAGLTARAARTE